tara:strand:+ start:755 stop:1714 length:960 start_codon:yes stop_codon:yes gene_type:complete
MILKAPKFWKKKNFLSFIFLFFSFIYILIYRIYLLINKEKEIGVPIICVGNAIIGGSGKTPIVIKLRKILKKKYKNIFVLTKGYKGSDKGPLLVSLKNNFRSVGDESLIHAIHGKTCVSKNRLKGAYFCKNNKSDLIIMDDGLQSKNVKKNLRFLVIDNDYMFGNNRVFPAGPLREPFEDSIKKAHAVIIIGKKRREKFIINKPIFYANKKIYVKKRLKKDIFAFSGLGNNENFFNALKEKFNIKNFKSFPDHHVYKNSEIEQIISISQKKDLSILCTLKDYLKIPKEYKDKINFADLEIKFEKEKELFNFVNSKINFL